jgi:predicted dehydrogenase
METLRVGIVGTGSIGMVHLDTLSKIPGFKITAVCDVRESALSNATAKSGVAGYAEYQKLVEQNDIDVVAVCTPNYLHSPVAVAALNAGKHVFVEKPMAYDVKAAKEMIAARDKSGKIVQIGVCQRFRGDAQVLKSHIEQGELGRIYFAKCGYLRRSGIPGMGSWFTTRSQSGGGPILDLGVHALDLTMYLMDNFKPVSVTSCKYAEFGPKGLGGGDWGTAVPGGPFDVEDLAAALIRFENGATIFLEVSWAAHVGSGSFYSTLMGEKAGADLDPATIYTDEFGRPVDKKLSVPSVDAYRAEHLHLHDCIVNGKQPMPSVEQGLAVQAVLEGIAESADKGTSVNVAF